MHFLLDRSGSASQLLELRVRIFLGGALIALAGIYLNQRWITGLAIVVLMAGILVRFLPSTYSKKSDSALSEDNNDQA